MYLAKGIEVRELYQCRLLANEWAHWDDDSASNPELSQLQGFHLTDIKVSLKVLPASVSMS